MAIMPEPQAADPAADLEVDVLIVGGGGAGLTASMLLSQLGVGHLLVSSWPTTSVLPKAHVLNQRTMEIMRGLGTADAIYQIGTPPENMRASAWYAGLAGDGPDWGRLIGRIQAWGDSGADPAWLSASPCRQTNLPQIRLEPLLLARANELAARPLRFNHELLSLNQDDNGVTATILDKDSDAEYTVRCRYLLACDGGRTVGRQVGAEMEGVRDVLRMVSLHMTADLSTWAQDPDVLIRWLWLPHTGSGAILVPMGPTRWGPDSEEWVCHLNYTTDDPRALDDEAVIADVRRALGIGDHPITPHLITRWSLEGLNASRFQVGRVFLLGDAAHRHPPTGGLGLTSATQDAFNLCWKIAAVLCGHADERLLTTYETERRPVDARNVDRSLENAANHLAIAAAVGLVEGVDEADNWAVLRRLWSGTPEDTDYRRMVTRAIASQSMEFNEHNIEFGYTYTSPAIIPDGTPEPEQIDPIRVYQPSTRPGHPLPHAWLDDDRAASSEPVRIAIGDLVRPGRFLLIAGEDGHDWITAANKIADDGDLPLDAVRIGHLDGDCLDSQLAWARHREITPRGAVLVRPDRYIAWRSTGSATDPVTELATALEAVLGLRTPGSA
ncbi:monooxygenase FAD-binding [Parafrankia sp. EAN1pec]|nr:monooxygenase FAD-binding [Frankia sp. EAN1pec]